MARTTFFQFAHLFAHPAQAVIESPALTGEKLLDGLFHFARHRLEQMHGNVVIDRENPVARHHHHFFIFDGKAFFREPRDDVLPAAGIGPGFAASGNGNDRDAPAIAGYGDILCTPHSTNDG
jgi:hypothetical protein